MIVTWYFLYRLARPLNSTSRHIFFEGCAACFCCFQCSTAALLVAAQWMESGKKDWYNMVNTALFLALLCVSYPVIALSVFLRYIAGG